MTLATQKAAAAGEASEAAASAAAPASRLGMERIAILILAISAGCVAAAAREDDEVPAIVNVQGYVYCQDCQGNWTKQLSDGLVSVICRDEDGLVQARSMDNTDEHGYFQLRIPMYDLVKQTNTTCLAQLVTSSDPSCNKITDRGNGAQGAELKPFTTYYNEMVLVTGPFAFTSYTCDE